MSVTVGDELALAWVSRLINSNGMLENMAKKVVNSFSETPVTGVAWGEVTLRAKEITLTQRGDHMQGSKIFWTQLKFMPLSVLVFVNKRVCQERSFQVF